MRLHRITDPNSPTFTEAFTIYESSFPNFEKRHVHHQREALAHEAYSFEVIQRSTPDTGANTDGQVLGLLHTWQTKDFVYIEHFAILESMRGKSLGSQVLDILKARTQVPIILEIDPPVDEVSRKRQAFYERIGFEMNDYTHIHPSYKSETEPYLLKILSMPKIDEALYKKFYDFMMREVMQYADQR